MGLYRDFVRWGDYSFRTECVSGGNPWKGGNAFAGDGSPPRNEIFAFFSFCFVVSPKIYLLIYLPTYIKPIPFFFPPIINSLRCGLYFLSLVCISVRENPPPPLEAEPVRRARVPPASEISLFFFFFSFLCFSPPATKYLNRFFPPPSSILLGVGLFFCFFFPFPFLTCIIYIFFSFFRGLATDNYTPAFFF